MATVMEKDVLLELVSGAIALIKGRSEEDKRHKENLKHIREVLYFTPYELLPFYEVVENINAIKSLYEGEKADLTGAQIEEVWNDILTHNHTPQQNPQGFVLGGQPGAGKNILIQMVKEQLKGNVVVIVGDDYRKYHPNYKIFQAQNIQDSVNQTQEFARAMGKALLHKAVQEKFNVVIEGTFRTAEVPIQTLTLFKENHYATRVLIQTCSKELSRAACLERYNKMLEVNPKEARYTSPEHHDLVCAHLAQNIKTVCQSGLMDEIKIFETVKTQEVIEEYSLDRGLSVAEIQDLLT